MQLQVWMEPGRYIVAESCVILTRVNQIKRKVRVHMDVLFADVGRGNRSMSASTQV